MGLSLTRAWKAPAGWAPSFHVATGGMETTQYPTSPHSRLLQTWTCPGKFSSPLHHMLQPRVKPTILFPRGLGELLASSLPCWLRWKESTCKARDRGFIPGSGRSPGEVNGNPFQYSSLGNPMDRSPWGCKQSDMTERLKNHHPIKLYSWLSSTLLDGLSHNSLLDSDFVQLSSQRDKSLEIRYSGGNERDKAQESIRITSGRSAQSGRLLYSITPRTCQDKPTKGGLWARGSMPASADGTQIGVVFFVLWTDCDLSRLPW